MRWVQKLSKYSSGENLMLGKFVVGGVHYDGARGQSDPKKWAATLRLSGMKDLLGHYEQAEMAKDRVESAVKYWIKEAGLKL